jgi:hypothetical protein
MANQATRSLETELPTPAKDPARRTTSPPETPSAPHAGRVGEAGARAERPSEGRKQKTAQPGPPGRGAKSPSASGDSVPAKRHAGT